MESLQGGTSLTGPHWGHLVKGSETSKKFAFRLYLQAALLQYMHLSPIAFLT